ncbi:MAG: branched-chain amino acid transport system ATP-binding protein [Chloroflexota bacterium]|jgi:branched-chain amino acid transport system ATP-binding protein|nr:branched-chain amino acid transport system ATP-binding protein [Chloroflexota bacterium]
MNLLEISNLDVYYGQVSALRGLSMSIAAGEMVALLGANGAGKTTTLRAISQVVEARSGSILFEGTEVNGKAPYDVVRFGITHLSEGRDLFPSLTVADNLRMGYWVRRKDKKGMKQRADHVMDLFPRLRERSEQAAGTLSGGEQQMLGVARALMPEPKLLIIDELSLGLAPMIVAQLFETLVEVNKTGTTILLVEQFVHMALKHTNRAYVLAKGEVVADGASSDLLKDPSLVQSYLGGAAEAGAAH